MSEVSNKECMRIPPTPLTLTTIKRRTVLALLIRNTADHFCALAIIKITLFTCLWCAAISNLQKQLSKATTSCIMGISPSYMEFEYPSFFFTPFPSKKIGSQCVLGVLCLNLFLSVGMLFSNISIWELNCHK